MNNVKLGKLPKKVDRRTLQFNKYVERPAPIIPPPYIDSTLQIPKWGMMANDVCGDCAIAGAAHAIQLWTRNARGEDGMVTLPDAAVVQTYSALSGYNPDDPSTDTGLALLDVLKHWRNVGIAGHKNLAFVEVDPKNSFEMELANYLFGCAYVGYALPLCVRGAEWWNMPADPNANDARPGSWGGHCVVRARYGPMAAGVITWGEVLPVHPEFERTYCDEAYAVLSPDYLNDGATLEGFSLQDLLADLRMVEK